MIILTMLVLLILGAIVFTLLGAGVLLTVFGDLFVAIVVVVIIFKVIFAIKRDR